MSARPQCGTIAVPQPQPRLQMLRVLVTGGAGFIGSHVVTALTEAGAAVRVIDDLSAGHPGNLAAARQAGLADDAVHVCDIRTPDAVEVIRRSCPEVVVHLAAQVSVTASRRTPALDADINVRGTVNVLDTCARAGVRLVVYAASCAIYGHVQPERLPVNERAPIRPASPYGLSKAVGLHYLDWYRRQHGLASTALVLGNVYGPRRRGPECGVVARMIDAVGQGVAPMVVGDGRQSRDFVHVDDVTAAVLLACTSRPAGLVNIASGREHTVNDVLGLVCQTVAAPTAPCHTPAVPGEVRRMALDIRRARTRLGWKPTITLTRGIASLVRTSEHDTFAEAAR